MSVDLTKPCDIWSGGKTAGGYGHVWSGDRMRYTHVLAWERRFGPVPDGFELDHVCRNRACREVDHLEVVTHAENCRRGERQKLTEHSRSVIARLREAGWSTRQIADHPEVPVGKSQVHLILNGRTR